MSNLRENDQMKSQPMALLIYSIQPEQSSSVSLFLMPASPPLLDIVWDTSDLSETRLERRDGLGAL